MMPHLAYVAKRGKRTVSIHRYLEDAECAVSESYSEACFVAADAEIEPPKMEEYSARMVVVVEVPQRLDEWMRRHLRWDWANRLFRWFRPSRSSRR